LSCSLRPFTRQLKTVRCAVIAPRHAYISLGSDLQ
jgi:hypothetical protein